MTAAFEDLQNDTPPPQNHETIRAITYYEKNQKFFEISNKVPQKEHYDVFWIMSSKSQGALDSYDNSNWQSLKHTSLKFIFKNESKAKIKRIIIDKITLKTSTNSWFLDSNPNKNHISKLLKDGESVDFYVNIFWDNNDKALSDMFLVFQMYDIIIDLKLITISGIISKEKIATHFWSFGCPSETTVEII